MTSVPPKKKIESFQDLAIGKRLGFFSSPELTKPAALVEEIGRMLTALRKRLEHKA